MSIGTVVRRLANTALLWSWGINAISIGSGLLLLPLLLHVLPTTDLGMYYLLLSLYALVPIVDFGFSTSVTRYVSYTMAGATELKPHGFTVVDNPGPPNFALLWRLLYTTRRLYAVLAIIALLLLGVIGTWAVSLRVHETSSAQYAWLAWAATLLAGVMELYSRWWALFLRGMNQVVMSDRIVFVAYASKLVASCILLVLGAGLLAVPIGGFVCSAIMRFRARTACLRALGAPPASIAGSASLFPVIWPNSWRVGLQFLSTYAASHANAIICASYFGLAANAQYGLSLQVAQMAAGMAAVWVSVKWPLVGHFRTQQDYPALRAVLQPRFLLQGGTYLVLAVAAFVFGPPLLRLQGSGKELLPAFWFGLLLLLYFLDLQFSFWTTLLSTENRVPSLWPTVISNLCSLALVLVLVESKHLRVGAFVLAPLVCGAMFSYWFWPLAGARSLRTNLFKFIFGDHAARHPAPQTTVW